MRQEVATNKTKDIYRTRSERVHCSHSNALAPDLHLSQLKATQQIHSWCCCCIFTYITIIHWHMPQIKHTYLKCFSNLVSSVHVSKSKTVVSITCSFVFKLMISHILIWKFVHQDGWCFHYQTFISYIQNTNKLSTQIQNYTETHNKITKTFKFHVNVPSNSQK